VGWIERHTIGRAPLDPRDHPTSAFGLALRLVTLIAHALQLAMPEGLEVIATGHDVIGDPCRSDATLRAAGPTERLMSQLGSGAATPPLGPVKAITHSGPVLGTNLMLVNQFSEREPSRNRT
jgi:hypothetical protein